MPPSDDPPGYSPPAVARSEPVPVPTTSPPQNRSPNDGLGNMSSFRPGSLRRIRNRSEPQGIFSRSVSPPLPPPPPIMTSTPSVLFHHVDEMKKQREEIRLKRVDDGASKVTQAQEEDHKRKLNACMQDLHKIDALLSSVDKDLNTDELANKSII